MKSWSRTGLLLAGAVNSCFAALSGDREGSTPADVRRGPSGQRPDTGRTLGTAAALSEVLSERRKTHVVSSVAQDGRLDDESVHLPAAGRQAGGGVGR